MSCLSWTLSWDYFVKHIRIVFIYYFNFPLFLTLDDLPVIDTDSDLDESEEDVEKDSGQQISDCDSESFDEKPEALPLKPTNVSDLYLF